MRYFRCRVPVFKTSKHGLSKYADSKTFPTDRSFSFGRFAKFCGKTSLRLLMIGRSDHMQFGVRWQPFAGRPQNSLYDANRPVLSKAQQLRTVLD